MSTELPGVREALAQLVDAARALVGALTRLLPVQVTIRWRDRETAAGRPAEAGDSTPGSGPPQHWLDFVARTAPEWAPGSVQGPGPGPRHRPAPVARIVRDPVAADAEPDVSRRDTTGLTDPASSPAAQRERGGRPAVPRVEGRPRLTPVATPTERADPAPLRPSAPAWRVPHTAGTSPSRLQRAAAEPGDPDSPAEPVAAPPGLAGATTPARTVARMAPRPYRPRPDTLPEQPTQPAATPAPADEGSRLPGPTASPRREGPSSRLQAEPRKKRVLQAGTDRARGHWPELPQPAATEPSEPLVTRLWHQGVPDDLVAAQRRS